MRRFGGPKVHKGYSHRNSDVGRETHEIHRSPNCIARMINNVPISQLADGISISA
jgi:hypothetical protein